MTRPEITSLIDLFESLTPPSTTDTAQVYSAVAIPGFARYRVAKDVSGAPALLIRLDTLQGKALPPPVRLQHLFVAHNIECVIHRQDGSKESGDFTVIRCINPDSGTIVYFLRVLMALLSSLGPTPHPEAINRAVEQLVELFRAMQEPPMKATQGLWAELLVITGAQDSAALLDAWHLAPDDLYDFSDGIQRIEVKSAAGQSRVHHFSLAQLHPPIGTQLVVASVMVSRVSKGCTIADLMEELVSQVRTSSDRVLRIYRVVASTLGSNWMQASLEAFDLHQARRSLAFFDQREIPTVPADLPDGVNDVRFRSDLSGSQALSSDELTNYGALISLLKRG